MKYISILFLLILLACNVQKKPEVTESNELWTSHDLTDSLFTSGIEGPAFYKGKLYLVNFKEEGTIGIIDSNRKASLFLTLSGGSIANGIRINKSGKLLLADYTNHNILQIDPETQNLSVYAHNDSMNQPNDIAIMDNDIVFASDPNWSNSTGNLWRVSTDGKTQLLEAGMGTTNGVEVSPDNKRLYINESIQRNVWVYDLDPEGRLSNKRLFIKFNDFGMDGMRTDSQGNLYIARYEKGTIAVVSPEGKLIREIQLKGKLPTNVAFGGPDGKTVYVTMKDRGRVEYFLNDIAGRQY